MINPPEGEPPRHEASKSRPPSGTGSAITDKDGKHRLYRHWQPKAQWLKIFLQMLIGVAVILMLIVKVVLSVLPFSLNYALFQFIASKNPLEITGYALAFSAGIELAYMLFTPGPDEAVEPLILGFSSAALILSAQEPTFLNAVILVVLVAGISVLFWVRKGFVDSESD